MIFGLIISSLGTSYASEQKSEAGETGQMHTTQHPPHDHHETDHIKKLDESMRRKREDE
ncbi:hypothetical protein H7170_02955 [Candidatus Gracilibacteria bacterium]|nr:hypothetical protein [Candidatus Gracilibacteria bacterium]